MYAIFYQIILDSSSKILHHCWHNLIWPDRSEITSCDSMFNTSIILYCWKTCFRSFKASSFIVFSNCKEVCTRQEQRVCKLKEMMPLGVSPQCGGRSRIFPIRSRNENQVLPALLTTADPDLHIHHYLFTIRSRGILSPPAVQVLWGSCSLDKCSVPCWSPHYNKVKQL